MFKRGKEEAPPAARVSTGRPASQASHAGVKAHPTRACDTSAVLPLRPHSKADLTGSGLFIQIFVPKNRAANTIHLTQGWGHGLASRSPESRLLLLPWGPIRGWDSPWGAGVHGIWPSGGSHFCRTVVAREIFFPELGRTPYGRDQRCCWVPGPALFPSTAVN